jgi:hypothetical protein
MNHRLDNDPQHTHRTSSPPTHRARPRLATTKRRARRSVTAIGVLAAASLAVPTAIAVSGPSSHASATGHSAKSAACVNTANGIPPRGHAYVGAAAGGTQSINGLTGKMGMRLREHRAYFTAGQVKAAVSVAKADLALRRLPWISFKAPYSWAAMARGKGDAWAADLTRRLARVGGPVWIAFHHEPEGDGPIQDWVRMQQRLVHIVHANSNNIAYSVIYSSWNITFGRYPLRRVFPSGGVDILGVDIYNNYRVRSSRMMDPMKFIPFFRSWADHHGIRWAIAESGYTQGAHNVDARWLDGMYRDAVANGAAAFSYFDSSKNSVANWTLDSRSKLGAFKRILSASPKIC